MKKCKYAKKVLFITFCKNPRYKNKLCLFCNCLYKEINK